jgi:hypothetical protein
MASSGDEIYCEVCGKRWRMTELGELEALSGETEFSHIPDWYEWQREQVRLQIENGEYSFSDEVEFIPQKDKTATSLVLTCTNKENSENSISGLDMLDEEILVDFYPNVMKNRYLELEAMKGQVLVMTAFGRTNTSATKKVYREAESIDFKGIYYRNDICKSINN